MSRAGCLSSIPLAVLLVLQLLPANAADPDLTKYLMTTWTNNSFYGFRGIRYAEAPINQLRFKVNAPILKININAHLYCGTGTTSTPTIMECYSAHERRHKSGRKSLPVPIHIRIQ